MQSQNDDLHLLVSAQCLNDDLCLSVIVQYLLHELSDAKIEKNDLNTDQLVHAIFSVHEH